MFRGTLSILQSLADNGKVCFDEQWLEYTLTNSSLSFKVAFLNTSVFLINPLKFSKIPYLTLTYRTIPHISSGLICVRKHFW